MGQGGSSIWQPDYIFQRKSAIMSRRFESRRLGFDQLEDRRMMAVTANVIDGDLVIRGNAANDQIQVVQSTTNGVPVAGRFVVFGLNGTRINGQAVFNTPINVTDDIDIDLGGGSDRLILGRNGPSSETMVSDELRVNMAEGTNTLTIQGITVNGNTMITSGTGNDTMTLRGDFGRPAGAEADLTIRSGGGSDALNIANSFVRHELNINTGISIHSDRVTLQNMNVVGFARVATGAGADRVTMSGITFNADLVVDTGDASDTVFMQQVEADEIFARLGNGNDTLGLFDNFARVGVFDGLGNFDTLRRSGNSFQQVQSVLRFESIIDQ
jgi:hypothetical protein